MLPLDSLDGGENRIISAIWLPDNLNVVSGWDETEKKLPRGEFDVKFQGLADTEFDSVIIALHTACTHMLFSGTAFLTEDGTVIWRSWGIVVQKLRKGETPSFG